MTLQEVFGGTSHCPMDDCHFILRFENCLTEDEAAEIMVAIGLLHMRRMHPGHLADFTIDTTDYSPINRLTRQEPVN